MMRTLLILTLFVSMQLMAQDEAAENPATPAPCSGEKYHQFDFWIGDWNVISNGQLAGTNSIHPILNGCALQEKWQGASGLAGTSFNVYDQANDQWHQTWIDGSGTLLELDGDLRNGEMVLQGDRPAADGNGKTSHRITWTPNTDGSVRQLWEATQDGKTWTVLFDGLYQKAAAN
jgi:hypothetical protein